MAVSRNRQSASFAGDSLVVIISETTIPVPLLRPLAMVLLSGLRARCQIDAVVGRYGRGQSTGHRLPKVFAAFSEKGLESRLNGAAEVLEEGYIVGAYGLLLRKCAETSVPAITLLTQSYYNYPDPVAAAAALTVVNKILELKVDVRIC